MPALDPAELEEMRADLIRALSIGALRVRAGDRDVTYRSEAAMRATLAFVEAAIAGRQPVRTVLPYYVKGT